jgi:hypothetical protein
MERNADEILGSTRFALRPSMTAVERAITAMDRTRGLRASFSRFVAAFLKELIQLRRDRITFATMIFIPLAQLLLFGFAINTNPKHLPTAVLIQDDSVFARSFMAALRVTEYFEVTTVAAGEDEFDQLLLSGAVQFGVQIPANFGRDLIRGERPAILLAADATDPVAPSRPSRASRERSSPATSSGPPRASPESPGRSRCACISATTRQPRRASTSCPASWAPS